MAPELDIRAALAGAWRLESYVEIDLGTGAERYPFGPSPEGIILYTADGYMSAQMQSSGRRAFAAGDLYGGEPGEYAEAGRTYLGYAGRFSVDEQAGTVSHEVAVSFFPNWLGQTQIRVFTLRGDRLQLETDGRQSFIGSSKVARITWRRAVPND